MGCAALVAWAPPSDAAVHNQLFYTVELRRSALGAAAEWQTVSSVRHGVCSCTIHPLCLRESYRVRVRAHTTCGAGAATKALVFATPAAVERGAFGIADRVLATSDAAAAAVMSDGDRRFAFPAHMAYDAEAPPVVTPDHVESAAGGGGAALHGRDRTQLPLSTSAVFANAVAEVAVHEACAVVHRHLAAHRQPSKPAAGSNATRARVMQNLL
jgi:hypothetical protein